jgi:hypothetical protein
VSAPPPLPGTPVPPVALAKDWRLVKDWRWILLKAHSSRWLIVAGILSGLEVWFAFFTDNPPLPRGVFSILASLTTIAAMAARFYAQKEES